MTHPTDDNPMFHGGQGRWNPPAELAAPQGAQPAADADKANVVSPVPTKTIPPARPASHDVATCPYFGMYLDLSEASGYPHEKDTMVSPEEYGAALLKDAERYRWLRDKSEPGICAFYLSVGDTFKGVKFARATVDEAIDAQIAAQTNTEGAKP